MLFPERDEGYIQVYLICSMYSAGFAVILQYLHTLFLFSVLPAKMKQTIPVFCYLHTRKEEITRKLTLLVHPV